MYEDAFEDDGFGSDGVALPLKVTLRAQGETLSVDFTGTGPQARGAINLPLSMTEATVYGAVKSIVSPEVLTNVGFIRPIQVVAPLGTLVNPRFPAAVGGRAPLFFRVFDMLFRALAQALPDRVPIPGEGGDVLHFTGEKEDGTPFAVMDIFFGGWGGRPHKDGIDGVAPMAFGSTERFRRNCLSANSRWSLTALAMCRIRAAPASIGARCPSISSGAS